MSDTLFVSLTPIQEDLAGFVADWANDEETTAWMVMGRRPWTIHDAAEWIRGHAWPDHALYWILLDGQNYVGWIGLFDIDWIARKAELRVLLGKERGHGVGTEACRQLLRLAFHRLNLERVWLGTARGNIAARRAFEKVGFKEEGILRRDFWGPNGWDDNLRMAALKEADAPRME